MYLDVARMGLPGKIIQIGFPPAIRCRGLMSVRKIAGLPVWIKAASPRDIKQPLLAFRRKCCAEKKH